jgi:hypothetical protein
MTLRKALEDHGQGYHPKYYLTHVLYRDGKLAVMPIYPSKLTSTHVFQVWHSSLVSSVCLHLLGCSVT